MKKLMLLIAISMLLLAIAGNVYSIPSASEALKICKKEVQQRYGTYSGSDSGLQKHMQKYIENCMTKFGYDSE